MTTGYGLIPIVCKRTAAEEGGYDECDEPRDDYEANANATDGEFAKGKDAVVEDKDGELQGGAGDWEDASSDEKSLNQAISLPRCERNGGHCRPNGTLPKLIIWSRSNMSGKQHQPVVKPIRCSSHVASEKAQHNSCGSQYSQRNDGPNDLVTAIVVEPGHSCGAYFSGINHGI
ncbi:MAG: hypothetical protein Q9193_001287 [Seirophora villosa]